MDLSWDNNILTILIILVIGIQLIHIIFSIYSYYYLRNKQFASCKKGEYRNVSNAD
jgi:hypothetical protein